MSFVSREMTMTRFTWFMAAAVAGWLTSAAVVQAGDNPILALAKEKIADPKKPFTLVVVLTAKEGQGKQLEELFKPAIAATRKEKGCIAYDLNRDLAEANKYYVYERWASVAALEAHLQSAHIKTLLSKIGDVLAGEPEVKFYAVAGE
jgi:quinol monooxygenase YgiN